MPLTYTGSSGIFSHIGALIARIDSYPPIAATELAADLLALETAFGLVWLPPEGIASTYGSLQEQVTGWRQAVARFCDLRLTDLATVLTRMDAVLPVGSGLSTVLPALARQMAIDGQTVRACYCATGAVVPLAGNVGNGMAFPTLVLDGVNSPLSGAPSSISYAGQRSQLCVPSETMTLECTSDSIVDRLDPGGESWTWSGNTAFPQLGWQAEGSGVGPTIRTDNRGANLLANGDFSTWLNGVPARWTLGSGVLVSQPYGDITQAGFDGNGVLYQSIPRGSLQPYRRYCVSLLVRGAGSAGTLTIAFAGASLSIPITDLLLVPTAYHFFFNAPAPVANTALTLTMHDVDIGASAFFSLVAIAPTTYHGGVGANVRAGVVPWRRGDRLQWSLTNNRAGLFQNFFRQRYGVQLPSVRAVPAGPFLTLLFTIMPIAVSESISETLVA